MSSLSDQLAQLTDAYSLSGIISELGEMVRERAEDADPATGDALESVAKQLDSASIDAEEAGC